MPQLADAAGPLFEAGQLALTPRNRSHFCKKLIAWFVPQRAPHPWRQERQGARDPYRVWVSEIMLQQTTLSAVTPKYRQFISALPTVQHLAAASEAELRPLVQGLGYYRRFNLLHKAARQLVADSPSKTVWPTTYDGWRELPGVGDYTAAAVSSFAFGEQKVALDGNGERILQRLLCSEEPLNAKGKTLLKRFAGALLGRSSAKLFNEALMELGQKICIRKVPRCKACPVSGYCEAHQRGRTTELPVAVPRRAMIDMNLAMVVPYCASTDAVGVWTRSPSAKFLKRTLGFVTCIAGDAGLRLDGFEDTEHAALTAIAALAEKSEATGSFRHAITHHKLTVEVRVVKITVREQKRWQKLYDASQDKRGEDSEAGIRFIPRAELLEHLTASLDSKTVRQLNRHLAPTKRR